MTTYLFQIFTTGQATVCPSVCMAPRKDFLPALRKYWDVTIHVKLSCEQPATMSLKRENTS